VSKKHFAERDLHTLDLQHGGKTAGIDIIGRNYVTVTLFIGKSELGISNMRENLPPAHRSRDTAHAQWLQTHCQWYPMGHVRTHNSRTDSRKDPQTWSMD